MSRWRVLALAREVFLRRGCSSEATGSQAKASCGRTSEAPLTFPPKSLSSGGRQSCLSPSPAQGCFPQIPQVTPHRLAWAAVVTGISVTAAGGLPNVELQNLIQGAAQQVSSSLVSTSSSRPSSFSPPSASSAPVFLGPNFIADAAAMAAPAVVNITVARGGLPIPQGHSGTGFIYNASGLILTNAHVVADALSTSDQAHASSSNATSCSNSERQDSTSISHSSHTTVTVALQDGRIFQGSVLMFDRVSDLAVVQIVSKQPLPAVKLGTSKGLRAGEWVLALGSPLHLQNSVTAGIISCVDRKAAELGLARVRTDYIQTDAAINRGNSGGPLVNLQGEVIGLACFKAVSADGVSFAIPIDTAKDVIQQLQQRGRVIRPYIGIKMLQLNQHNAAQMRQKDPNFPEVMQGILVPFVAANSPAAKCGLREGDVITGACGAHNCMHDCSRATVDHAHSILRPQIKQQRAAECSKHACRYA
ncbi:hypothetical protein ABBQ38_009198 [Trebouxia sp. C0009 RCD-2024]